MTGDELRARYADNRHVPNINDSEVAELAAALDDRDRLECVLAIGRPCFFYQSDGTIALANDGVGGLTILGKGKTIRAAIDAARGKA